MAEKNGSWFLELILNILLLGATAFVTFAAKGEQERLAAATRAPSLGGPSVSSTPVEPVSPVQESPKASSPAAKVEVLGGFSFQEAMGALGVWAAGLDGAITSAELDKIMGQLGTWEGAGSARDFLKGINDNINAGKGQELVRKALEGLASQAYDKKVQVTAWVVELMKNNGLSWTKINEFMGQWMAQLKLKPLDLWSGLRG